MKGTDVALSAGLDKKICTMSSADVTVAMSDAINPAKTFLTAARVSASVFCETFVVFTSTGLALSGFFAGGSSVKGLPFLCVLAKH
eukprot:CAMPEP_0206128046 /NCGR_PEP_ID=MMETSP1472-20131121/30049_1 /ASSEMBLY_ACC=CAM_ASM_001108 /TAXON_ID=41880 /ORGANISM="Pycnococcus provasolii, Strain RCC251" /LENGTH=85 /DNA_ID=CAMNT_0053519209 /DNA_START=199 /DNA_END=453 /DNA_ORIENTATION=-